MGALFGFNLTVGQTIDTWAVSSFMNSGLPGHDVVWGLSYVYITTDPFINTNFTSTPPSNPDVILWQPFEDGGDRYTAVGKVDSLPEPGVAALSSLAVHRRGKTRSMKPLRS